MGHLRSPRAMIWPTLRAIGFPPWLATEAHNWRTLATSKHGCSDSLNRGWLIGRQSASSQTKIPSQPRHSLDRPELCYELENRERSARITPAALFWGIRIRFDPESPHQ